MPGENGNGAIMIPRWFTYFVSGLASLFVAIFLPWGTWVSANLLTIAVKVDAAQELRAEQSALEGRLQSHHAEITKLNVQLQQMFDSMRRFEREDDKRRGGPSE